MQLERAKIHFQASNHAEARFRWGSRQSISPALGHRIYRKHCLNLPQDFVFEHCSLSLKQIKHEWMGFFVNGKVKVRILHDEPPRKPCNKSAPMGVFEKSTSFKLTMQPNNSLTTLAWSLLFFPVLQPLNFRTSSCRPPSFKLFHKRSTKIEVPDKSKTRRVVHREIKLTSSLTSSFNEFPPRPITRGSNFLPEFSIVNPLMRPEERAETHFSERPQLVK